MKYDQWFYKHQKAIDDLIDSSEYARYGGRLSQSISSEQYFELWDLEHKVSGEHKQVMFLVMRGSNFINIYTYQKSL